MCSSETPELEASVWEFLAYGLESRVSGIDETAWGSVGLEKESTRDPALGTFKSLAEEEEPAQEQEAKLPLRWEEDKESVVLGKPREGGEFQGVVLCIKCR